MSENWKIYKFEELYAQPSRNGLTKPKRIRGEGFKMVNMGELFRYSFIGEQEMDRVPLSKTELSNSLLEIGDILFARQSLVEAGVGKCSLVKNMNEPTTFESHIIRVRPNTSIADPAFLYYLFNSASMRQRLISMANGVAAFGIKGSELSMMELNLPPIQEQREISCILSAIDDKIEINLQMNKTLEEMALTLYKHWFVDFGPFKDGEFIDSELGMIPKGWEVKFIQELGKMFYGQMPKKELIVGEGYPIYSGYRYVGYYPNYNCDKGKVIVVARGVGGTGDIKLTSEKCFLTNLSICFGNDIGLIDDSLLFFGLKRYGLDHLRTGSAQPQITINDLNRVEILVPPKDIQSQFLQIFSSLLDEMESHTIENQILTTLRDTLLPKLISGEVRVKDAEKALAEVL